MVNDGSASSPSSPAGVQSLERALDILELLGQSDGELGVTEVAPGAGLANGTAHRLLATLVRRGYVRQNPENREYALGIKAYTLSTVAREHLGPAARPFLTELMEVSQESSNLAALEKTLSSIWTRCRHPAWFGCSPSPATGRPCIPRHGKSASGLPAREDRRPHNRGGRVASFYRLHHNGPEQTEG